MPTYRSLTFSLLLVLAVAPASAQDATTITQSSVSDATGDGYDKPLSIVLLGEQLSASSGHTSAVKVMSAARDIIGGMVTDETTKVINLKQIAENLQASPPPKSDVYIVFAGAADEVAGTSDDEQRATAQQIAELLGKQGRVFLVPSGTTVSASISANLRLAALQADATYVTLGTESGGRPVEEAFEAVRDEVKGATSSAGDALPPVITSAGAATTTGGPPTSAAIANERLAVPDKTPAPPERVRLSEELSRIAGEAEPTTAAARETTDSEGLQAIAIEDSQTTGRTMSKRGAAAKDTINMRPLPAVKAFRPKIPVPRNQVNEKEPALSR